MTVPAVRPRGPLTALPPASTAPVEPSRMVVRRAPSLEPPYDDERDGPRLWLVPPRDELPFDEPAPRRLEQPVDFFDAQPTSRRSLPEPEPWAARLIQAVLETLTGRRRPAQLQEWMSPFVLASLSIAAGRRRWATPGGPPPAIRSVRACEPADGVAEICVVVQTGQRFFAVAGRLEGLDGKWRCVALHLG